LRTPARPHDPTTVEQLAYYVVDRAAIADVITEGNNPRQTSTTTAVIPIISAPGIAR